MEAFSPEAGFGRFIDRLEIYSASDISILSLSMFKLNGCTWIFCCHFYKEDKFCDGEMRNKKWQNKRHVWNHERVNKEEL